MNGNIDTDTGRFEDASPKMLRDLLSAMDGLDDRAVNFFTHWAQHDTAFIFGNVDTIDYYVREGRRNLK